MVKVSKPLRPALLFAVVTASPRAVSKKLQAAVPGRRQAQNAEPSLLQPACLSCVRAGSFLFRVGSRRTTAYTYARGNALQAALVCVS